MGIKNGNQSKLFSAYCLLVVLMSLLITGVYLKQQKLVPFLQFACLTMMHVMLYNLLAVMQHDII